MAFASFPSYSVTLPITVVEPKNVTNKSTETIESILPFATLEVAQ